MDSAFSLRQRMNATGIGYAGIDGIWWLPATAPFSLPAATAQPLTAIGRAIFCLFDVVTTLYGTTAGAAAGLNTLLAHKVPTHFLRYIDRSPVLSVRPDFQLYLQPDGRYQLVATELEICPSAQGFAYAMQVGYGLSPDLVAAFAQMLHGRTLIFVSTQQWSEFLFEQLAFCQALETVGAQGRVLLDLPLATLADRVMAGECWQPPIFGVPHKPVGWNPNITQRLDQSGLRRFLWSHQHDWPTSVGDAVVFRFGYLECFEADKLQRFVEWAAQGATFLNPTHFIFDSKVIMAALNLPAVRQQIAKQDATALAVLDRCIPTTYLLQADIVDQLCREQANWVIKFAGYDSGNQAWGGRSLQLGMHHSADSWRALLQASLSLPWPVVAQQIVPSARVDIAYFDAANQIQWLRQGNTRLRSFFVRDPNHLANVVVGGSHVTVVGDSTKVSEGVDAVQAPAVFADN